MPGKRHDSRRMDALGGVVPHHPLFGAKLDLLTNLAGFEVSTEVGCETGIDPIQELDEFSGVLIEIRTDVLVEDQHPAGSKDTVHEGEHLLDLDEMVYGRDDEDRIERVIGNVILERITAA